MPIDKPEATADATSRRAFIARSAIGAAVVGSGVLAGFGRFGPAGAQAGGDTLNDDAFGRFMTPLELGAVQAYQVAIDSGQLGDLAADARRFQNHHRQVATSMSELIVSGDDDTAPAPDQLIASAGAGGMAGLAEMEAVLAATHLLAIEQAADTVTGRASAQIAAVQSQQSVVLALGAGLDLAAITPAVVSLDNARQPGVMPTGSTTTGNTGNTDTGDTDQTDETDATTTSTTTAN